MDSTGKNHQNHNYSSQTLEKLVPVCRREGYRDLDYARSVTFMVLERFHVPV